MDTLAQHGAGAVQNTYTLIRKGIRRVLKLAGYDVPLQRRGLAANLAAYLDSDRKADIEWADPTARAAHLKVLVQDAEAVLDLALAQADDPDVRAAAWLLTKILGDDVTTDETGQAQIGEGTAPDRIISLTDIEMRHGRKSAAQRFDGRKWQVAEELTSELLVVVEPVPANVSDGRDLLSVIDHVETQAEVTVERVIADGAYGTGDNRADCLARDIELVSPLAVSANPDLAKTAFTIDLTAGTVTCPHGQMTLAGASRPSSLSAPCVRRARCLTAVCAATHGRSIVLNFMKPCSRPARQRQPRRSSRPLPAAARSRTQGGGPDPPRRQTRPLSRRRQKLAAGPMDGGGDQS